MEFDNDRVRKRFDRQEWACWVTFLLIPLFVNGITLFATAPLVWVLIIFTQLILFPAYLFYARGIAPLLFERRYLVFWVLTVAMAIGIQAFSWAVHLLIGQVPMNPDTKPYFTYSGATLPREVLWNLLKMGMALGIAFLRHVSEENNERERVDKDNLFYRLRYLRAQVSPHFLFNTLNSIYSLSMQRSERTPELVVRLADLMRYIIYECNEDFIPLDKEIEFIRNYIEIERVRYQADIKFTVEGDTQGIRIEPFLFIAFVENGFKHAMDSPSGTPFIYIHLKADDERIVLNVINSTNADLESQAKRINGRGLTNSKSLLELLYPGSYKLDLIQTEREEARTSDLRLLHAKERLEALYPDAHTLDVILNKNVFTVSLIIQSRVA